MEKCERDSSRASLTLLIFIYFSAFEISKMQFDRGVFTILLKESKLLKKLNALLGNIVSSIKLVTYSVEILPLFVRL